MFYEEMKSDLKASTRHICEFLNIEEKCTEERIKCVEENSTGDFKRNTNVTDHKTLFSPEQLKTLYDNVNNLYKQVEECGKAGDCVKYVTVWPIGQL